MRISDAEVARRFEFHEAATQDVKDAHAEVRRLCGNLAAQFVVNLPPGREAALAITHLEEAMFWANAAVARPPMEYKDAAKQQGLDKGIEREFLVRVDSVCSLVAHRGLDDQAKAELKEVSHLARAMYEGRS